MGIDRLAMFLTDSNNIKVGLRCFVYMKSLLNLVYPTGGAAVPRHETGGRKPHGSGNSSRHHCPPAVEEVTAHSTQPQSLYVTLVPG